MKIKEGFVMRRIGDGGVVVAVGEASKSFHGMIKLNKTAADIWSCIADGKTEAQAAEFLTEKYEVDAETARGSVDALIAQMRDNGILVP